MGTVVWSPHDTFPEPMLTAYPLNGFLRITDPGRARHLYEQVLGLTFDYENPYVSVFRSGDTTIIAQVRCLKPRS